MTRRVYFLLFVLGLTVVSAVAAFQPAPGYMDADYYFATALQLAEGNGFSEPFLWNYLDNPAGLPHPSHGYWLPLTSLLALPGLLLSASNSFSLARLGFLLTAALIPPVTAGIAFALTERRVTARWAGLLAVFPSFYLPFMSVTDTFAPYMLLGGLFFLAYYRIHSPNRLSFILGLLAGWMFLCRADGLLWLLIAALLALAHSTGKRTRMKQVRRLSLILGGFALIAVPWISRNFNVFGTPFSPGGARALWFTDYNQLFAFPVEGLNFESWRASGWGAILRVRGWALGQNAQTALAVQGEVFLAPFMLVGFWTLRQRRTVQIGGLAWLLTAVVMTVIFPFAGARGGFFHSGVALQPSLWALAAVGLDASVVWGARIRGWRADQARGIFAAALLVMAVSLSGFIVGGRVVGWGVESQPWGGSQRHYQQWGQYLDDAGIPRDVIILVNNPPGFYLASLRPAIVIPDGDTTNLLAAATHFDAKYLLLEFNHPPGLDELYAQPELARSLQLLHDDGQTRLFAVLDDER